MIHISLERRTVADICVCKIQVRDVFVCKFDHFIPDGLAECLRKAADAVEFNEWAEDLLETDAKGG